MSQTVKLSDLALELGLKKSTLTYYALEKLIVPVDFRGNAGLYDGADVRKRLKTIESLQAKGKSITDIKDELRRSKR